jgi:hypothetical protein
LNTYIPEMHKFRRRGQRIGTLALILSISPGLAMGDAGWYPTHVRDTISVEFCLPSGARSPVYLQLMELNQLQGRTLAVIHFSRLKEDSYCRGSVQDGVKSGRNSPVHLKYNWKVNVSGSGALQIYIPNIRSAVYGWPDGFSTLNQ